MLAAQRFVHFVIRETEEKTFPIQFDVMIIPQAVTKQSMRSTKSTKMEKNLILNMQRKTQPNDLDPDPKVAFWNLGSYLEEAGYRRGFDYFVSNEMDEYHGDGGFTKSFASMWKKSGGRKHRGRRYIFIIDRRNPENVKNHNMNLRPPHLGSASGDHGKGWKDRVYLVIAKEQFMRYKRSSNSNQKESKQQVYSVSVGA